MADSKPEEKKVQPLSFSNQLDAEIFSGQSVPRATAGDKEPVSWADHLVDFMWQPSCELSTRYKAVQQFLCLVIDPRSRVWDRNKLRSMSQDAITFFSNWEGRK